MSTNGYIGLGIILMVLALIGFAIQQIVLRKRISDNARGALLIPIVIVAFAGVLIISNASQDGGRVVSDNPPARVVGITQQMDANGSQRILTVEYGTTGDRDTIDIPCGSDQQDCLNAKLGDVVEYITTFGPAGFNSTRTITKVT